MGMPGGGGMVRSLGGRSGTRFWFDPALGCGGGGGGGRSRIGGARESGIASVKAVPTKTSARAVIIGVMEHIEEAGIHSGDSVCSLPPYSLSKEIVDRLKQQTRELAKALRVRGLMNVQYAIKDNEIYVIEVNPRASRTVPFVGKATGVPWAKIAAKVMAGETLGGMGVLVCRRPKNTRGQAGALPRNKGPRRQRSTPPRFRRAA